MLIKLYYRSNGSHQQQPVPYFFLPAYPHSCKVIEFKKEEQIDWWKELDVQVNAYAMQHEDVTLDRIFIVSTHPHLVPPPILDGLPLNKELRNVMDIRYMRSDNQETPNGRDVFVPHVVRFHHDDYRAGSGGMSPNLNQTVVRRQYFLFAPCLGKWDDRRRRWPAKAFNLLRNVSDSIVINDNHKYDSKKFDLAMKTSDFCIILPGATTSSVECWKAIFAGCIPVVFLTNKQQLPYDTFLDWSRFSIVVLKDILNKRRDFQILLQRLQDIRNNPKMLV